MKKLTTLFLISFFAIAIFAQDSTNTDEVLETTTTLLSEVPAAPALPMMILYALIGGLLFFAQRDGKVWLTKGFDISYYFRKNANWIGWALLGNIIAVIGMVFKPDLLDVIVGWTGYSIPAGEVGTIAFHTLLTGTILSIKNWIKERQVVATDGNGNAIV